MARVSKKNNAYIQADKATKLKGAESYKTAIYARLSVEDNGKDSDSLEAQIQYLNAYLEDKPQMQLCGIFADNGFTGTNYDRPEFQKMMNLVKKGEINCIVVKDLSRLGRNYIDTGNFLQKICPMYHLRLIAVNDRYDTAFAGSNEEMSMSVMNIANDMYAKDISRKICSSLQGKMERGEYIGNYAPYGYQKNPENKNHLIIDPLTAPVVRRIYELRAEGLGISKIAKILNEAGIPSPGRYRYENGIITNNNKKGKEILWNRHVLTDLLKNIVYQGHLAQAKAREALYQGEAFHWVGEDEWVVCKNTHEPIISEELFVCVQEINQKQSNVRKESQGKYAHLPKAVNPYGKKLVCADCGSVMKLVRGINRKGDKVYFTFKCPRYIEHRERGCTDKSISQAELDLVVLDTLNAHIQLFVEHTSAIAKLLEQKEKLKGQDKTVEERIRLEQEIKRLEALKNSLYMDLKEGLLMEEEYRYMKKQYEEKIEKLKNQIEQQHSGRTKLEEETLQYSYWLDQAGSYEKIEKIDSDVLETWIEKIGVQTGKKIKMQMKYKDQFREAGIAWEEAV